MSLALAQDNSEFRLPKGHFLGHLSGQNIPKISHFSDYS